MRTGRKGKNPFSDIKKPGSSRVFSEFGVDRIDRKISLPVGAEEDDKQNCPDPEGGMNRDSLLRDAFRKLEELEIR